MISVSKGDVLEDRLVKEHALLLDEGNIVAEPVDVERLYGVSVYQYYSRAAAVESHQKICQRAFSRAAPSNNESRLSRRKVKAGAFQSELVRSGRIRERYLILFSKYVIERASYIRS